MRKVVVAILLSCIAVFSTTAKTPIKGTNVVSAEQLYNFVKQNNSSFDREIAEKFISVSAKYGIRGDIALCQSIIETGWFKYTGGTKVTPEDHNYCGLGVTVSQGYKKCTFDSVEEGVEAQMQHLWAYCCKDALPSWATKIDPRFDFVTRGCAPNWEDLSRKWSTASNYGTQILSIYNDLLEFAPPEPASLTASQTTVTLNGVYGSTDKPYVDVKITGKNLTGDIKYNNNSSIVDKPTVLSDWNARTGGTLRITLNTNFTSGAGTYSGDTYYVSVQSGSGENVTSIKIMIVATLTASETPDTPDTPETPEEPEDPETPDSGLGDDYLKVNMSKVTLKGVLKSTNKPYVDVTATGNNLTADISVNSGTSAVTVEKLSDWNARTGGTLRITLNTNFVSGAGTYTDKYVAIQSTASHRIELPLDITLLPEGSEDPNQPETPETPTNPDVPDPGLSDGNLKVNVSKINLTGEHLSSNQPYIDIIITGIDLTTNISINSNSGILQCTKLSDFDNLTGGTVRVTLNTKFGGSGTVTKESFIAITSTPLRIELPFVATLNESAGIEDITIDENAKYPVEWYNLQGIKADGDNIAPGMYLRRQGNKVTKVVVK